MLDVKRIAMKVGSHGFSKILVQVPEGLKAEAQQLASAIENEGMEAIIDVDPCYGACDLRDHEAVLLGCDALLHMGHSSMGVRAELPVMYWKCTIKFNPLPALRKGLPLLKDYATISMAATVQYLPALDKAAGFLKSRGKTVALGRPSKTAYSGQILGCDQSGPLSVGKNSDCFLVIAGGMFHALGMAAATEKPVFLLDAEKGVLKDVTKEGAKRRMARASKAAWARGNLHKFVILVSTRRGQMNVKTAEAVRRHLAMLKKESWIVSADLLTPQALMGLKYDCLVNCACPRLSEDTKMFGKIIIDAADVMAWK